MATISARVDDKLKASAESVADAIGISLSTAINIFLKRSAAERGFPFDVVAPAVETTGEPIDREELVRSVQAAVADKENTGHPDHFTYLDPSSGKLIADASEKADDTYTVEML